MEKLPIERNKKLESLSFEQRLMVEAVGSIVQEKPGEIPYLLLSSSSQNGERREASYWN